MGDGEERGDREGKKRRCVRGEGRKGGEGKIEKHRKMQSSQNRDRKKEEGRQRERKRSIGKAKVQL